MGRISAAHGYENGNKRTGLAVGERFLEENGYQLQADTVILDLIVRVVGANKNRDDPAILYETLATALKERCTPNRTPSSP